MSREKEIIKAANQRTMEIFGELDDFQDRTEGFIDGAKWADKTMIDKACEWLLKGGYFVNSNETIEDFRKAMEE